jgi:hypothetical protein
MSNVNDYQLLKHPNTPEHQIILVKCVITFFQEGMSFPLRLSFFLTFFQENNVASATIKQRNCVTIKHFTWRTFISTLLVSKLLMTLHISQKEPCPLLPNKLINCVNHRRQLWLCKQNGRIHPTMMKSRSQELYSALTSDMNYRLSPIACYMAHVLKSLGSS